MHEVALETRLCCAKCSYNYTLQYIYNSWLGRSILLTCKQAYALHCPLTGKGIAVAVAGACRTPMDDATVSFEAAVARCASAFGAMLLWLTVAKKYF